MRRTATAPLICGLFAGALLQTVAEAQLRPAVADPEAAARAEIESVCLRVEYGEDFVRRLDLTADGLDDVVIRYDVVCDGYGRFFCGPRGCRGDVFVALEAGGFRPMGLSPYVEPAMHEGRPAVAVRHARLECATPDAPACRTVRVWDGELFVPPAELGRAGPRTVLEEGDDGRIRIILGGESREVVPRLGERPEDDAPEPAAPPPNDALTAAPIPMVGEMVFEGVGSEEWRMEALSTRRAVARIAGADGRSGLAVSCAFGDRGPRLLIATTAEVAEVLPSEQGASRQFDIVSGGRVRASRVFLYSGVESAWATRLLPNDPVIDALTGGAAASARDHASGAPVVQVALTGSRGAIDEMLAHCRL